MTSGDGPSAAEEAQRGDRSFPSEPSELFHLAEQSGASRPARPGRSRPWWQWLLISMLLAFSLTTTGLYAASLIADMSKHDWGAALDASRAGVPAAVGWAAVILLFSPRRSSAADRLRSADDQELAESLRQAARDQTCADSAQHKVGQLTARLYRLTAAREHARSARGAAPTIADKPADAGVTYLDPGAVYLDPDCADLDREIAETTARLNQATQWLESARTAASASQRAVAAAEERLLSDFPDLARRRDRAADKPA